MVDHVEQSREPSIMTVPTLVRWMHEKTVLANEDAGEVCSPHLRSIKMERPGFSGRRNRRQPSKPLSTSRWANRTCKADNPRELVASDVSNVKRNRFELKSRVVFSDLCATSVFTVFLRRCQTQRALIRKQSWRRESQITTRLRQVRRRRC